MFRAPLNQTIDPIYLSLIGLVFGDYHNQLTLNLVVLKYKENLTISLVRVIYSKILFERIILRIYTVTFASESIDEIMFYNN